MVDFAVLWCFLLLLLLCSLMIKAETEKEKVQQKIRKISTLLLSDYKKEKEVFKEEEITPKK